MNLAVADCNPSGEKPQFTGTVVAVQANYYRVQLDPVEEARGKEQEARGEQFDLLRETSIVPRFLLCTRRSRLKKIGQQVMVGDRVVIEEPDWAGGRGAIAKVFPRQTELDRPPVANANQLLLVFALEEPTLDPHQLTRFLVKAESTGLAVCLCLNKSDLVPEHERQQWKDRLAEWGYQPLFISVQSDLGLNAMNAQLTDKITVISGPSGVGKSSLINHLIPTAHLRVADVSGKLGRGRHTTRHVELFELPSGGLLADTPGFNQPELDCTPEELVYYFPEARRRLEIEAPEGDYAKADRFPLRCQFSDCLHRDEPNCVVRGDWERYDYYLEFLEDAIAHEQVLQELGDGESSLKLKSKRSGQQQYEPKLETKKYRRLSRRMEHQTLQQDTGQDLEEL